VRAGSLRVRGAQNISTRAGFKFILNQENNQKVSIRSMHCNY